MTAVLEPIMINGRNLCLNFILLFMMVDNQHFDASTLYLSIGLLNTLRLNVLRFMFLAVRNSTMTAVSVSRVEVNLV